MLLNNKWFLTYKLFNSAFTGLSVGILFTIYNPLDPEIYSLGGIILASAMLILAKFYEKLLNIKSFYFISILVEACMLITVLVFLILKYSIVSALTIYILFLLDIATYWHIAISVMVSGSVWATDAYMCGLGGGEKRKCAHHSRHKQILKGSREPLVV